MLSVCLDHKSSLVSAIEVVNDRPGGPSITITNQDYCHASGSGIGQPFKEATEALEGDYIALPLVYCNMSVLDSHIESEIAAFVPGSSAVNVTEVMLPDHK